VEIEMARKGVTGAIVFAKDLQRLARFYREVANLPVTDGDDRFCVLGEGPGRLVIQQIPPDFADQIEITSPPQKREETPIKLALAVDDIAAARARAADCGGTLLPPDREWTFGEARVCDGIDPEGNVFQVQQGD
jgi:predicted enzyme related to lactoylglutathione lyase